MKGTRFKPSPAVEAVCFLGGPNFTKVSLKLHQIYGANIAENYWMEDEMSFWGQKACFQKAFAVSGNDKWCKTLQTNVALVNTPFALVNTTTGYGCKRYSIAMIDCFSWGVRKLTSQICIETCMERSEKVPEQRASMNPQFPTITEIQKEPLPPPEVLPENP